jgi:O-antigen/teichoic acid export membrane protein
VGLAKGFESVSDIAYGSLQHQERMDRISISMMLRGAIAIAALWAGVYFTGSVFLGAVGMAAGWCAVLVLFDLPGVPRDPAESSTIRSMLRRQSRLEWRRLSRLAIVAAPLGVVMMLLSLNVNVPRYVIQHNFGEGSLGIFAAVAYLMVAGTTVVGALGQSASPRLADYYARGDVTRFRILMGKLIAIAAALGAAGILVAVTAGRPLLRFLFRPDYAASSDVLTWMMAAAALSYVGSFLGYGLTAARRFTVQAPLIGVVTVVTAAASVLLIPGHGLIGAAWATMLGSTAQMIGCALVLRHTMTLKGPMSLDTQVVTVEGIS